MVKHYVKLPNGRPCQLHGDGFVQVKVVVEMEEIISRDREGFLDLLSMRVAGSEAILSEIDYTVVDTFGKSLEVEVVGAVADLESLIIKETDLPTQEFRVALTRISWSRGPELTIYARSADEAADMAEEGAGDHLYSEVDAKYSSEVRQ